MALTCKCPSCQGEMIPFDVRGITLDGCPDCDGLWFDAEELDAFAGADAVRSLVESALGQGAGCRCKGCRQEIPDDPRLFECPSCRRPIPRCPKCLGGALVVGNFRGINLDVCRSCHGLFFDAGELQLALRDRGSLSFSVVNAFSQAREARARQSASQTAAERPVELRRRFSCETCGKKLSRKHVFVENEHAYCGSCAPKLACPLVVDRHRPGSFETEWNDAQELKAMRRSAVGGMCHSRSDEPSLFLDLINFFFFKR